MTEARGLDIDDVSPVANFDILNESESYVHRIGCTGRADTTGIALSVYGRDELGYLHDIEQLIRRRLLVAN